jgi:sulfate adenylyltransferase
MIEAFNSSPLNPLYVDNEAERKSLLEEAASLPSLLMTSGASGNAVMLGAGYFSPLPGFMSVQDALEVAENMRTANGMFWPIPILNMVQGGQITDGIRKAGRIALRDPNQEGRPVLAIQEVSAIEEMTADQLKRVVEKVFGTLDVEHLGVAAFMEAGAFVVSGPIQVLDYSYFPRDFPDTFRTAAQIRALIQEQGWDKVVAFQTRNPMHRAHEELCRMAREDAQADGILIHMLLGKLKPGDIPADVRDAAIRKMVELYFPANTVLITGYGFDMMYAGPREAVLHAIFRQNAGASHFIIGRDHAGVGDYYEPFDAQDIFDEIPAGALTIEIFKGDHTVWCFKCGKVTMMRDCPHDQEDYLQLSGTNVRQMLSKGETLPAEFARPEVAEILSAYYQSSASD